MWRQICLSAISILTYPADVLETILLEYPSGSFDVPDALF